MSIAVLISIKPEYCRLITNGEKTIEVRKNRPQINVPFKVYIYCTKHGRGNNRFYDFWKHGTVIGEFVCDTIVPISVYYSDILFTEGKSTFPFTGLTDREIINYLGNGIEGYGWHISDLMIYDTPKELQEFKPLSGSSSLKKAPQSWCYVEGD